MCSMQSSPAQADLEEFLSLYNTLDSKAKMSSPKKESIAQIFLNAVNTVWENVSNYRSSLAVGPTCPLSVKIVNDDSSIQEQILKDLTSPKELLDVQNMYTPNNPLEMTESILNMFNKTPYTNKIFNENTKNYLECNYKYDDSKKEHSERSDKKESIEREIEHSTMDCNCSESSQNTSSEEESFEFICTDSVNTEEICSKDTFSNKLPNNTNSYMDNEPIKMRSPGALDTNGQEVLIGAADTMTKQVCSPKHRRKLRSVAKNRSRGRDKSQLRRSGVSQRIHREVRMKQYLAMDIENDPEDLHDTTDDSLSSIEFITNEDMNPVVDVEPKVEVPRFREDIDQEIPQLREMRCVPGYTEESFDEVDFVTTVQENSLRPRKYSESSMDSEDSCVVFEAGPDAACESEVEENEESDETSEDEDTCREEEPMSRIPKVRFNLTPVIHRMVKWDYAYRAARKGPWEEMARDNDRFQRRIRSVEHVVHPILTMEHRNHVWQERFAVTE